MTPGDFHAFRRIQRAYFTRVCTDDSSLLARIYGIYQISLEDQEPVSLVVMGNSMSGARHIEGIFDLKGSLVNRYCKPIKDQEFPKTKTLKDQNLLNKCKENILLKFRMKDRAQILNTLRGDVQVLEKFNLMDYSLLLCI